MKNKQYALITGASSGLGKALAIQCAANGFHLILIDLSVSNLNLTASQLKSLYPIDVRVFAIDLANYSYAAGQLTSIAASFNISLVINNAGIGGTSLLKETSLDRMDHIISVNIRSMVMVVGIMAPKLMKQPRSYILNVSSMAAFTPIAYKNVYPASKAFISSFSLGLREEFSTTNVSVSVLYPGSMMTNFSVSRRIMSLGNKGRRGLLTTDDIAETAICKTLKKKSYYNTRMDKLPFV